MAAPAQVELSGEPQGAMAEGQLVCCRARLSNTGAMPLQDLRLAALSQDTLLSAPCPNVDEDPVARLAGRPCNLLGIPVWACRERQWP